MHEHTVKTRGNTVKIRGRCGEAVRRLFRLFVVGGLFVSALPAAADSLVAGRGCAIDGDSLILGGKMINGRCRGGDVEIRIQGIDAPEWNQVCGAVGKKWPCGATATTAIRAMINGKDITCQIIGRDRYKRGIGICQAGGVDLARELVRRGLAMAYRKYSKMYVADEDAARAAKIGIWSGPFETPTDWRRKKRK